jgi:4-amino-4-deoxy-L-arabinose transferase-like glycosyltransferase
VSVPVPGPMSVPVPERVRLRLPGGTELLVLLAILALAALTRLPGLDARGPWDADQGTDMRVLAALVDGGEIPLLGPRTSIGTFHHGAAYYWLLAPAALLSGADPVAVTGEIALFGIAAVAGTWWLGRLVGGPLAGAAAGLLAAVSPAAIDESIFIWNPNLVPAAAALAFGAAIAARRSGRARWWVLSGLGAMVTMQCHVLGVVVLAPLGWAWASDVVRRRRGGLPTGPSVRGGLGALLVVAAGFLPLLAYELGNDFAESRAIMQFVLHGGAANAQSIPDRVVMVALRTLTWPFAGLLTDRIWASMASLLGVAVLAGIAAVRPRRGRGVEPVAADGVEPARVDAVDATAARWLLGALGVSVVALALFAGSLAVIVRELPADHYHAFLDPVVLALVGAGLARLAGMGRRAAASASATPGTAAAAGRSLLAPGRLAAGAVLVALLAIAVSAWPPTVSPDGGWALADHAAGTVLATTGDAPVLLDGIPPFKNANALRFPLEHRGAAVLDARDPTASATGGRPAGVLVCDPVFDGVVGEPCGGPAEGAWLVAHGAGEWQLLARFEAGPRRVISVFGTAPAAASVAP